MELTETAMTARIACAAALIALTGASAAADLSRLPGTYRAEAGSAACRLRLDAPASAPEDSLIEARTVSGLVLAFPGCPAGLSDAMLWRAAADGSELSLIDAAGGVVLQARPGDGRAWRGETPSGETVSLSPA